MKCCAASQYETCRFFSLSLIVILVYVLNIEIVMKNCTEEIKKIVNEGRFIFLVAAIVVAVATMPFHFNSAFVDTFGFRRKCFSIFMCDEAAARNVVFKSRGYNE